MKALIQLIIIALIVAGSILGRRYLIEHAPKIPQKEVQVHVPLVEVVTAKTETHRLFVTSEGAIAAPTRMNLTPEVSGRVIELGAGFEEGALLEKGSLLLVIDPADYSLAQGAAQAELDAAMAARQLEQVAADVAIADWRELNEGTPPPLVSHAPQLAAAQARIASAKVAQAKAALALSRTKLRMPFSGRIVAKNAELGQRVDPAAPAAVIERAGDLEVRLALNLGELGAIGLDPSGVGAEGLDIVLEADIAGTTRRWKARGARTAADLSPMNPVVTLIATVEKAMDGGPLPVPGLFVRARITGHEVEAVAVPRIAVDITGRLLVMDAENHIAYRNVHTVQTTRDEVLIDRGLESGERVVTVPPPVVIEGMLVTLEQQTAPETAVTPNEL
jgi:RND family efflux transporter MFP subunit